MKECQTAGVATRLPGERTPAIVVASRSPFFLTAGIFEQRLVVSESVIRARRSLLLAQAMVRLAREGVCPEPSPVASTLLGSSQNLSVR